jgi:hypothetical protein
MSPGAAAGAGAAAAGAGSVRGAAAAALAAGSMRGGVLAAVAEDPPQKKATLVRRLLAMAKQEGRDLKARLRSLFSRRAAPVVASHSSAAPAAAHNRSCVFVVA